MLTQRIDAALQAMADCQARVPELRDLYHVGSRERAALTRLLASVERAQRELAARTGVSGWPTL
jgi:hypothetical protein